VGSEMCIRDRLQCALNPLFCDDFTRKQDYIA
jgi:hypothetical protein